MSFYGDNDSIQASSATYRKAKLIIEEAIGIEINNSRSPKQDFLEIVDSIDDKLIEAYKKGLRRGCKQMINWILDGTIKIKDGNFIIKDDLEIEIKRKKFDGSTQVIVDKLAPQEIDLNKI